MHRPGLLSLLFVLSCAGCAMPKADALDPHAATHGTALTGDWGGEHVALSLTASGGRIEYDCAQGTLDAPVVPDAAGTFSVAGRHVPGHGGPVRIEDQPPASQPAIYQGTVSGDRMQLRVSTGGQDTGAYVLQRGADPQLFRCL